jgi:hypothetical protein
MLVHALTPVARVEQRDRLVQVHGAVEVLVVHDELHHVEELPGLKTCGRGWRRVSE